MTPRYAKALAQALALSQFGSSMTVAASSLGLAERYGVSSVALNFALQSVPPLLLPWLPLRNFKPKHWPLALGVCQIALAACVLLMAFHFNRTTVPIASFLIGLVNTLAGPLFAALSANIFSREENDELQKKLISSRAAVWSIAPLFALMLAEKGGLSLIFLIDAFTYLGAGIVFFLGAGFTKNSPSLEGLQTSESSATFQSLWTLSKELLRIRAVVMWHALGLLCAVLNVLEWVRFQELQLTPVLVGSALTCWGVGGLLSYLFRKRMRSSSEASAYIGLAVASAALTFIDSITALHLSLLILGFTVPFVSGIKRVELNAQLQDKGLNFNTWKIIQQQGIFVSLLCYLISSATSNSSLWLGLLFVGLSVAVLAERSLRGHSAVKGLQSANP